MSQTVECNNICKINDENIYEDEQGTENNVTKQYYTNANTEM